MKVILDTNCYISFISKRHAGQHAKMVDLMDAVSRMELEVLLTGHNFTEIVFVMESVYKRPVREIKGMLVDLLRNPGIYFEAAHFPEALFRLWPEIIKDYGDAVLAAAAYMLDAKVFTFDEAFARALRKQGLLASIS